MKPKRALSPAPISITVPCAWRLRKPLTHSSNVAIRKAPHLYLLFSKSQILKESL